MSRDQSPSDAEIQVQANHRLVEELIASTEDLSASEGYVQDLKQALQQAQELEAVGRLAGGVAHDFNNLLTVITGSAELIRRGHVQSEEDLNELLDEIIQTSQRGADLTRQLLAFSRKQLLRNEVIDVGRDIQGMANMLQRLATSEVRLEIESEEELYVSIDSAQVHQVLLNLVANSRDAMSGEGDLRITAEGATLGRMDALQRNLVSGEYVLITTSDSGCGLTKEVQQRVFDPFFTTKPVGEGTGLGLATAYGIIRQSGGSIEVDSEPGAGAIFRIYLPRVGAPSAEMEPDSGKRQKPAGGAVLLVDDEASILKMATRALEADGFEVIPAGDGAEALAVLSQRGSEIDLVITDMVMPIIGGRGVIEASLAMEDGPRVMAVSGYSQLVLEEDHPEIRFLTKPYTASDLVDAARATLS